MIRERTIELQSELDYFEHHRFEWLEDAPGQYALVKNECLEGFFHTEADAVRAGYRKFGNEAFLVKRVVEADVPLIFTSFNLGL